jgi:transposase-like protein
MMAERGIALAHTTILRWVQRYVPDFEKRWNQHARAVGDSWRLDETYIKIKGQWMYLYRAVDKACRTVDFLLSKRRDVAAAQGFFSRAIKGDSNFPLAIAVRIWVRTSACFANVADMARYWRQARIFSFPLQDPTLGSVLIFEV